MLKKSLSLFFILVIILAGCSTKQNVVPVEKETHVSEQTKEVKKEDKQEVPVETTFNFLPKEKTTYQYEMKNNEVSIAQEYAFFEGEYIQTMEPTEKSVMDIYKQDNTGLYKVEWYCNFDEGTVVKENLLTQIDKFSDCKSFPLIKYPIKMGETWEDYQGTKYEVISLTDTLITPAGEYKDVVKVKIHGEINYHIEYFAKDVGLVKSEIYDTETNELINFMIIKSIK